MYKKQYIKNRTLASIAFTLVGLFFLIILTSNFADNIKKNELSTSSQNISNVQVLDISINQGSSASDIASLLSAEGIISSQLELSFRS